MEIHYKQPAMPEHIYVFNIALSQKHASGVGLYFCVAGKFLSYTHERAGHIVKVKNN